jgi:hypothetical protein
MAFLNPPSAPLFQGGERGDFCRCPAKEEGVEKYGGFFQKAKVLEYFGFQRCKVYGVNGSNARPA